MSCLLYPARCGATAALALTLAGCSTLFPKNIDPPVPVFTDGTLTHAAIKDQNADSQTLMAGLEHDLVLSWLALSKATFANETLLANRFLNRGISLLDARCDQYFHALGRAAQRMTYGSKALGLTSGLVAALQGLTGVAARDMALTGSGLGFLGASSQAYGEVFIFSPEVSSVQSLVAAAQGAAKARIEQMAPADFNKGAAINLLQDYEKTCEVHTIRRLVNESLASAKPIASFATDDGQVVLLKLATKDALARLLKVAQINDEQLTALYWLTYNAPTSQADLALIAKLLSASVELVGADGKLKTDAAANATRSAVRAALTGLVVHEGASAELMLDRERLDRWLGVAGH